MECRIYSSMGMCLLGVVPRLAIILNQIVGFFVCFLKFQKNNPPDLLLLIWFLEAEQLNRGGKNKFYCTETCMISQSPPRAHPTT